MLEYEFETVPCRLGGGLASIAFGAAGIETQGHREAICRRAEDGWRYAGCIPRLQRAEGYMESIDLIFEREIPGE